MFESGRCRFIAAGDPSGIQACMVCEELLQPAVRQRMSEQPFDCRKGACRHIGNRRVAQTSDDEQRAGEVPRRPCTAEYLNGNRIATFPDDIYTLECTK